MAPGAVSWSREPLVTKPFGATSHAGSDPGMRRSGSIAIGSPMHLQSGDHVCWAYGSDAEHREVLTSYLLDGLHRHERVAYYAPNGGQDRAAEYLTDAGQDVPALLAGGQLLVEPAEDAYLPNGRFDADERLDNHRAMVETALS